MRVSSTLEFIPVTLDWPMVTLSFFSFEESAHLGTLGLDAVEEIMKLPVRLSYRRLHGNERYWRCFQPWTKCAWSWCSLLGLRIDEPLTLRYDLGVLHAELRIVDVELLHQPRQVMRRALRQFKACVLRIFKRDFQILFPPL